MKSNFLLYEDDKDLDRYNSIVNKLANKFTVGKEDSLKSFLINYFEVDSLDEVWDDEVGTAIASMNSQSDNDFIRSFAYKVLSESDISFIRKSDKFKSNNDSYWYKILTDMGKKIIRLLDPEYVTKETIGESRKIMNESIDSRYFITVEQMLEGEIGNVDDKTLDNDIRKFGRIAKKLDVRMEDVVVYVDSENEYNPEYYMADLGIESRSETLYGKYFFTIYTGDYKFCCDSVNGNLYFYADSEDTLNSYFNDVDKLNGIDEAFDKNDGSGPYWYFTIHGVGPGSVPKDIEILDVVEGENQKGTLGDFFLSDKVLTTDELNYYDCIELSPNYVTEDTKKKKNGKWVNKGEDGEHGEFETKKEVDAQRKAMFANGYHEDLNETSKQKFIGYCKGKISNLGTMPHEFYDESVESPILMIGDVRDVVDGRIVEPATSDEDTLTIVDKFGNMVYDTPMSNPVEYALRMEFTKIDREFYHSILQYWDEYSSIYLDNDMSESFERNNLPTEIRKQANAICNRYNGWHEPKEIRPMWDELSELGIEVLIMGYPHKEESGSKMWTVSFDYNGEPCDNSRFVYSVYEGSNSLSNEYLMYFS